MTHEATGNGQMRRSDWLLLLLSDRALDPGGPQSLDPLRIQKGMFLASMRGPQKNLYDFQPYNWGPFSRDVYGDLDKLGAQGLVASTTKPGQSWSTYQLTDAGYKAATDVAAEAGNRIVSWLSQLRRYLTSRSFNQLLTEVYDAYPEYATRSQFAGA